MTRSEFNYGKFSRTIPLPIPVDNDRVKGDYQDGILSLELPKLQQQENKVTKVNIGSGTNKNLSGSNSTQAADAPSANNVGLTPETETDSDGDIWDDSQPASQPTVAS